MEFIEDEARPRFVFRSGGGGGGGGASAHGGAPTSSFSKLHALSCVSAAALLLLSAAALLRRSHSAPASLLAWGALSLLLAPFAPSSITGGDPRVGRGPPLPDPAPAPAPAPDDDAAADRRNPSRRSRSRKPDHSQNPNPPPIVPKPSDLSRSSPNDVDQILKEAKIEEEDDEEEDGERDWTEEDFDLLKKQIAKHPVGEPQRWERIAEAFKGRHEVSSVIRMAKSLPERKPDSRDSFQQFLKHRKPSDRSQSQLGNGDVRVEASKESGSGGWSPGEDLALLNALKAFPKDAPMRWEKIAVAVPGKSRASCAKRVAELKRDFRSSKASQSQSQPQS